MPLPPPSAPRQDILRGGEPLPGARFTWTAMLASKTKSNGIWTDREVISNVSKGSDPQSGFHDYYGLF